MVQVFVFYLFFDILICLFDDSLALYAEFFVFYELCDFAIVMFSNTDCVI